jgi:hypothetical protein
MRPGGPDGTAVTALVEPPQSGWFCRTDPGICGGVQEFPTAFAQLRRGCPQRGAAYEHPVHRPSWPGR